MCRGWARGCYQPAAHGVLHIRRPPPPARRRTSPGDVLPARSSRTPRRGEPRARAARGFRAEVPPGRAGWPAGLSIGESATGRRRGPTQHSRAVPAHSPPPASTPPRNVSRGPARRRFPVIASCVVLHEAADSPGSRDLFVATCLLVAACRSSIRSCASSVRATEHAGLEHHPRAVPRWLAQTSCRTACRTYAVRVDTDHRVPASSRCECVAISRRPPARAMPRSRSAYPLGGNFASASRFVVGASLIAAVMTATASSSRGRGRRCGSRSPGVLLRRSRRLSRAARSVAAGSAAHPPPSPGQAHRGRSRPGYRLRSEMRCGDRRPHRPQRPLAILGQPLPRSAVSRHLTIRHGCCPTRQPHFEHTDYAARALR